MSPGLRPALHGGYALCHLPNGQAHCSPGRGVADLIKLSREGNAFRDWLTLLGVADDLLRFNEGVSLAPRLTAPPRTDPGSATCVTDASGIDGFGGYAFVSGNPNVVFTASEKWPPAALSALHATADPDQAELRRRLPDSALPSFPMPAGELFAAVLLPRMLAREISIRTCFAVGDCDPAVRTLASMHSAHPQMRRLVAWAASAKHCWVPAQVPREANMDADRLSHPDMYPQVLASLQEAGLIVHRLFPTEEDWTVLAEVISASKDADRRPRGKKSHRGKRGRKGPFEDASALTLSTLPTG